MTGDRRRDGEERTDQFDLVGVAVAAFFAVLVIAWSIPHL